MQKVEKGLKSVDNFGITANLSIDKGKEQLNSYGGALCSLILFTITFLFSWTKIKVLVEK